MNNLVSTKTKIKSKKIIIVSHCVLNQNSVIEGWARAKGAFSIAELLIKEGVGIIQLPCPEIIYNGINRPPLGYEDYNKKEYRELCCSLLSPYIMQIKDYLKNGYSLLGVIAINKSPTCSISGKRGVLMEELFAALEYEEILLPFVEIPEAYNEEMSMAELEEEIYQLLKGDKNDELKC